VEYSIELSITEDNRASLKEAGAIPVLVKLLAKNARDTQTQIKQAVAAALSNLSESATCKVRLMMMGTQTSNGTSWGRH